MSQRLVPGYAPLDLLGHGGMAEVWRARHEETGEIVALKLLAPAVARDTELVAMFLDEARLGRELSHPNIVRCFDVGYAIDGRPYMVLEYVDGRDLRQVLTMAARARAWLPLDFSLTVAREIAYALDHAHWARDQAGEPLGIIHRDVSHSNVFLSRRGEVKLADFGIARARGRNTGTHEGLVKGKLGYLAPEQIRAEPLDARTDVFAACVVLWELLTQRRMFVAESEFKTMLMVTRGERVAPSEARPGLPIELDALVLPGVALDPDHRYPSAGVFGEAVQRTADRLHIHLGHHAIGAVLSLLTDEVVADPTPRGPFALTPPEEVPITHPGRITGEDDPIVVEPPSETFAVSTHDLAMPPSPSRREAALPPLAQRSAACLVPLNGIVLELYGQGHVVPLESFRALQQSLTSVQDDGLTLSVDRRHFLAARDARDLLEIDPEHTEQPRTERVRGIETTVVLGDMARRGKDGWVEVRRGPVRLRATIAGGRLLRVQSDAAEHHLAAGLTAASSDLQLSMATLLREVLIHRRPLRAVARERLGLEATRVELIDRELAVERLAELLRLPPIHLAVQTTGGGARGSLPELAEAIERAWLPAEVDAELQAFDARVPVLTTLPTQVLAPGLLGGTELLDDHTPLGVLRERAAATTLARLLALLALGDLRLR